MKASTGDAILWDMVVPFCTRALVPFYLRVANCQDFSVPGANCVCLGHAHYFWVDNRIES